MTNNVIQIDRYRSTLCMPHGRDQEHRPPERKPEPAPCPKALPTSPAFDGRRKSDADSPSIEPNITEVLGKHGKKSYRVQIRKTVNGVSKSFAKTFSQLPMARKWKKRILAELELNGINVEKSGNATVADAITARLSAQKSLCRSAVQQLNWLRNSPFGAEDLSKLAVESLQDLADDMLGAERMPQTVAGYLSILVATLNWASKRSFSIPVSELRTAMEIMWEDEISRSIRGT